MTDKIGPTDASQKALDGDIEAAIESLLNDQFSKIVASFVDKYIATEDDAAQVALLDKFITACSEVAAHIMTAPLALVLFPNKFAALHDISTGVLMRAGDIATDLAAAEDEDFDEFCEDLPDPDTKGRLQ